MPVPPPPSNGARLCMAFIPKFKMKGAQGTAADINAQLLTHARASTYALGAILHEQRYVGLFESLIQPDDPVRTVKYKDFDVGRDDRSVCYVEDETLVLLEPQPGSNFVVVADRQVSCWVNSQHKSWHEPGAVCYPNQSSAFSRGRATFTGTLAYRWLRERE